MTQQHNAVVVNELQKYISKDVTKDILMSYMGYFKGACEYFSCHNHTEVPYEEDKCLCEKHNEIEVKILMSVNYHFGNSRMTNDIIFKLNGIFIDSEFTNNHIYHVLENQDPTDEGLIDESNNIIEKYCKTITKKDARKLKKNLNDNTIYFIDNNEEDEYGNKLIRCTIIHQKVAIEFERYVKNIY